MGKKQDEIKLNIRWEGSASEEAQQSLARVIAEIICPGIFEACRENDSLLAEANRLIADVDTLIAKCTTAGDQDNAIAEPTDAAVKARIDELEAEIAKLKASIAKPSCQ